MSKGPRMTWYSRTRTKPRCLRQDAAPAVHPHKRNVKARAANMRSVFPLTRGLPPAIFWLAVFGVVALRPPPAAAQSERIPSYHGDITVQEDSSLRVIETIKVTAAGQRIKRGIYRDFPTLYASKYFTQVEVPFHVVSVLRDGKPEPYHTKKLRNGVRVYVGREDFMLPHGQYNYQLTYTTDFQLGYFEQHDELYWNVTGNGWAFPIGKASATVHLPADVPLRDVSYEGYTGQQGSKGRDLAATVNADAGTIEFATTRMLEPQEGLTIVVGFPKGYVREPTAKEKRRLYFRANLSLWIVLGGLVVVAGYYAVAWVAVGRDPPGQPIYPQFHPPLELPPACVRYLRQMGYDKKCFTAAVLSMAVKGHLTIEQDDEGQFTLRRNGQQKAGRLSAGERAVASSLLRSKSVVLRQSNHRKIRKAVEKLGERLALEYNGKLFLRNRWWLVPGWLLSAAALVIAALSCGWDSLPIVGFLCLWLSIWTLVCILLAGHVWGTWRSVLALRRTTQGRFGSLAGALAMTAFATPFLVAEVVVMGILIYNTSIWMLPLIVGLVTMNVAFWHLIKQPTVEGRRVMDAIEGFRMYLGTAEREFLQRLHPPDKTPELFEKYLPYALALDVENEWAEQFADVLAGAAQAEDGRGTYRPTWYHGSDWNTASHGAFAAGLGSALGGAVSSSSSAPGSSSGGGGGGFTGGGGGGGGGGGW